MPKLGGFFMSNSSLDPHLLRKLDATQQQLQQVQQALLAEQQRCSALVAQLQGLGVEPAVAPGPQAPAQPEASAKILPAQQSSSQNPSSQKPSPQKAASLSRSAEGAVGIPSSTSGPGQIQAIYTDGACQGNPGPGGWGTVVYFSDGSRHEMGGGDPGTTNNRMEMQAAVAALQYYRDSGQTSPISLYTDSEYLKNGITKWIKGWKQKGWKTSTGKPVLNQDIWEALDQLNSPKITWLYVKGHAGNEGNERCDVIARAFSQSRRISLTQKP
jgi:ribonuclease HI